MSKRKVVINADYTTEESGLSPRCTNRDLLETIRRDVAEISVLTVEVTVYANYHLTRQWMDGRFKNIRSLDF